MSRNWWNLDKANNLRIACIRGLELLPKKYRYNTSGYIANISSIPSSRSCIGTTSYEFFM
jgi:hypothetical protein